jgi:hypothetical protein
MPSPRKKQLKKFSSLLLSLCWHIKGKNNNIKLTELNSSLPHVNLSITQLPILTFLCRDGAGGSVNFNISLSSTSQKREQSGSGSDNNKRRINYNFLP